MHDTSLFPLSLMVQKLATHAVLSPADCDALLHLPFSFRTFEPGSYLVREGDVPDQCGVLASGYAYRHKTARNGGRQIVSLHLPGEILDLQHLYLDVADHSVQTLTQCHVATVPRSAFRALVAERPAIAHAIFVNVLVEGSIFREWLLNIGQRDARQRVAHLLCEFAVRLDKQGMVPHESYRLPMTQEQLGDALGLTTVHVNRTLRTLVEEGMITHSRRSIGFASWEALKKASDFDDHYLHLSQQVA